MAKNTNKTILVIIVLAILYYLYINSKNKPDPKMNVGIDGCTSPSASNYNPEATSDDGSCIYLRQACCNILATDYDPTCANDISCQCSESQCTLITGRQSCCDSSSNEYDPTCAGDPDCSCDQSLCLNSSSSGTTRTSCCVVGSTNYDSSCLSDPYCSCDTTICQQPAPAHQCHTICNGNGGYTSIFTTIPCGTGYATNYPNTLDPYCNQPSA